MNINFKATTIELTDEIRTYAEEKTISVTKLLKNVDAGNISADVSLEKKQEQNSGNVFRADITIHAGAERVHAVGHGESIMAAIDIARDDLVSRMGREKKRRLDALRRGGAKVKKLLRFWK